MLSKFKDSLNKLTISGGSNPSYHGNPFLLLAVSGGIDSMCMAHLFSAIHYGNFAIATVNFSLRGEESDGDEELVKNWAAEKGIRCFSKTFDTASYSKLRSISTQMAARELRYDWFDSLLKQHGFEFISIAHNLNDSVETFCINVLRGTGLQGMTGIREKNGNIIRPLLSFTRMEIAEYVKLHDIPFREDSTNSQSDYSRNRIRNMVFPEFEMINPSFLTTVERDMHNVQAAVDVLEEFYDAKKEYLTDKSGKRISVARLLEEKRPDYWLYILLDEYGFNYDQLIQIYDSLKSQPGKEFHSESHMLIKDRDWLLLYAKGSVKPSEVILEKISYGHPVTLFQDGHEFRFSLFPKPEGFKFKKEDNAKGVMADLFNSASLQLPEPVICLDYDLLSLPLKLRPWNDGDKFRPLGMKGFKKLSDFLTDLKIDKVSKNSISLLVSGDIVAAVPGYRVDDRFKLTSSTSNILEISIVK